MYWLIIYYLFTIAYSNCINFNDDANLLIPDIIKKYNYPIEIHNITTDDGYILSLHRIPYRKSNITIYKGVVLLMHGVLGSSADFIIAGPQHSLGYILSDEGYDVWLANTRGNRYSRNHIKLNPKTKKFWNFSWNEMGVYDVPNIIDYIIKETDEKQIFYIGHSQGTTIFYIMCSEKPQYNDKIRAQFSLAPVAYLKNIKSPIIKILSVFHSIIEMISNLLGVYEFFPRTVLFELFCTLFESTCENFLDFLCGFDRNEVNSTMIPLIMAHLPAGSSFKQFVHYSQLIHSGHFSKFDYGMIGNIGKYRSFHPPNYNLKQIQVPIYLFYSKNDWISSDIDVVHLKNDLNSVKDVFLVPYGKFNHFDYLFAIHAPQLIYNNIIDLMTKH